MVVLAVDAAAVGSHGDARHRLDATADDQILHAAGDAHGGEVDRLQSRAAETVQGDAGDLVGPAGCQGRHATDARPLFADLLDAAGDDVFDVADVETACGASRSGLEPAAPADAFRRGLRSCFPRPRGVRTASMM